MLPGIYLIKSIPATNRKELSLAINKVCAKYFNEYSKERKIRI
jgi:hypothetical protein